MQGTVEGAIDPDLQVVVMDELAFEEKDPFEKNDVDVAECVAVFAKRGRGFFGKVGDDIDRAGSRSG